MQGWEINYPLLIMNYYYPWVHNVATHSNSYKKFKGKDYLSAFNFSYLRRASLKETALNILNTSV